MLAAFAFACGCAPHEKAGTDQVRVREPVALATGQAQTDRLCARPRTDQVVDVFCHDPPSVTGLLELRAALGLQANENDIYQGYVLNGHSTSLALRSVSAINPRIIFVGPRDEKKGLVFMAFARGEQFSEVITCDIQGALQFYLVAFSQACNLASDGCSPGDLFTEAVESGWQDVNVYAEEDLENTPRDCRVCHQPDGPGTAKLLRMQESEPPWDHWFWRQAVGGRALLDDYYAAKGNEVFAGVPGESVVTSQPGLLSAALFSAGSQMQPNPYTSARIDQEVIQSAAAMGGDQPTDNSVPGQSATWNAIYESAKRGDAISVPYHDVKISDAHKLAELTQAYVDYRAGRIERAELPDLRDIHPDDPLLRAQIGLITEPGLDGQGVLLQACAQCHNDRLDPGVSRARFNVDLNTLGRAEKDRAIGRLMMAPDHPSAMPPAFARALSDEGRARLVELLQR
jgi:mono/diheme cytochrome c family protein